MMTKIEIGVGFLLAALAGLKLLDSLPANPALLIIALFLISHAIYELIKLHVFLKRTVAQWLGKHHWVTKYIEGFAGMYFVMEIRNVGHREWLILVTREHRMKQIIAFSAKIPFDPSWQPCLSRLSSGHQQWLVDEIRKSLNIMQVGYERLQWPIEETNIQVHVPIDQNLSEHSVADAAAKMLQAILVVRATIRQALVERQV